MPDLTQSIKQQVEAAIAGKTPLNIVGGNSKSFYGGVRQGEALNVAQHRGIVTYEPTELVMSVRAGTTLEEIEHALAANNQMLPFEPPHFGATATIGGTIACNLSGPRRAYTGAARDFVLGTTIVNGHAEVLKFGGEVMKNVAGYDVSRLMAGAMGTLGVLLDVSFKALPKPAEEITLVRQCDLASAIITMNQWAAKPLPISATAYGEGQLYVRLSGAKSAVQAAHRQIGGEVLNDANTFWYQMREQQTAFFTEAKTLWRVSVPQHTAPLKLQGDCLVEWGGGLRWLISEESPRRIREVATAAGGQATLFKCEAPESELFQPLDNALLKLHRNLKQAFDPQHILNPGRLYPGL